MANLNNIDLDDLSRDMNDQLDMVQYAIMAAKSPDLDFDRKPNFSRALVQCVKVGGIAEFILANLRLEDIRNRERFEAILRDSEKLTKRFWANFQLVNVHRENGGSLTLGIPQKPQTVAENLKGKTAKGRGKNKGGKRAPTLSDKEADEIIETINTIYKGRCSQKELQEIADAHNRGLSTIQRLYYDHRKGR